MALLGQKVPACCVGCPGDALHLGWNLVLECAALQGMRNDMPALFIRPWYTVKMWHEYMVIMSKFIRGAMRTVRAASSGDELDV